MLHGKTFRHFGLAIQASSSRTSCFIREGEMSCGGVPTSVALALLQILSPSLCLVQLLAS